MIGTGTDFSNGKLGSKTQPQNFSNFTHCNPLVSHLPSLIKKATAYQVMLLINALNRTG